MTFLKGAISVIVQFIVQFFREWKAEKRGEVEGREDAVQKAQAEIIQTQQKAKEVKNEVNNLGGDDLKRRAGRWVRSKPKGDTTTGK